MAKEKWLKEQEGEEAEEEEVGGIFQLADKTLQRMSSREEEGGGPGEKVGFSLIIIYLTPPDKCPSC